ncbi:MAG TPA: hypothetical protein ENN77_02625, partial [Candidatus Wirthbacteria bacterium]|nr:hypothetical protein [Candidatus Wirthbacteria bacterium]
LLGMSNVLSSILNSHHKIFAATLSPIMYNLGIIMGALVFEPLVGIVWGLGLGVAFGAFMHFAIQLWPVARLGFKFSWDLDFKFEGVKDVIRLATPRMIGLAIAQADMFVDVILGSFLPVGSIALLNYANRLQTMPVGIFGMAIATACFPVFVQKSVKKDWQGFNQVLFKNLKYVLFFTIPTTVAMVLMRVEIIRILFGQSGKLSWFETRSVAFALSLYAISIFAQSTVYILSRAFYAVQDTKTPVVASLISVGLNSLLSFILVITVQHFSMLALSYSIASLVNMTLLFVMLHHKLGGFKINSFLQSLLAILSSSLVMGLAIWAMRYGLQNFLDLSRVRDLAIEISICSLVGVGIYFVSMSALGKNEMGNFLNSFKKGKKC